MNRRTWMSAACVLVLAASLASANATAGGTDAARTRNGFVERYESSLALTPVQQAEIRQLEQQNQKEETGIYYEMQRVRAGLRQARKDGDAKSQAALNEQTKALRAKLKESSAALTEKILGVLTPEQRTSYDALMKGGTGSIHKLAPQQQGSPEKEAPTPKESQAGDAQDPPATATNPPSAP